MKFLILVVPLFVAPLSVNAEDISFDDFVPPTKAGNPDPQKLPVEKSVTEKGGVVEAQNAQDGLNYALKQLLKEDGDGVKEITVPSGFAVLAISTQDYNTYKNRNATLLSKRSAYAKALAVAKKNMVGSFDGVMNACERSFSDSLATIDTGSDEGQANIAQNSQESCKETVSGVLAGYVLYYVKDNAPDNKTVTVALASSTKTRTAIKKVGGAVISTQDMRKAWEDLMTEITSGLVPPMGARLLSNPKTGEKTVVGFGSSIVRLNRNNTVARKLRQSAKRMAQIRANNSLVSFLNGDKVYWEGGFDEAQVEKSNQFEVPAPAQPGEEAATPEMKLANIKVFDQTQSQFLNTMKESNDYKVITAGHLPPGIKQKSFVDQSGDWAIAISVYSAGMTARAEKYGSENRAATGMLDKYQQNKNKAGGKTPATDITQRKLKTQGGLQENGDNPRGPSGSVTRDSDL